MSDLKESPGGLEDYGGKIIENTHIISDDNIKTVPLKSHADYCRQQLLNMATYTELGKEQIERIKNWSDDDCVAAWTSFLRGFALTSTNGPDFDNVGTRPPLFEAALPKTTEENFLLRAWKALGRFFSFTE